MLGRHEVTNKAYEPRHAVTDPTPENTPLLSRVGLKAGGLVLEYLDMIQEGQQAWDKMYNTAMDPATYIDDPEKHDAQQAARDNLAQYFMNQAILHS
jgi:hypothetical protein